jgi:glycosyltransferase involved in cell wall biosynthesis
LDDSDAFVLPSREETFGVVVIEALSRGLPVVATRSGGPEYIVNNDNGIVVSPGDPDALAAAIIRIAHEYDRFDRYKIQQEILAGFGSGRFLATMQKIYNEVTKVEC